MEKEMIIVDEVREAGFDCGIAIATEAEIQNGAACGQLSLVNEEE